MSGRRVGAVARRIVAQFRHDRRSLALLIVPPILVMALVGALWGSNTTTAPRVALAPVATGPGSAAVPALTRSTAISAYGTSIDAALDDLRGRRADAAIIFDRVPPRIVVEGSDPLRTSSAIAAVQRAFVESAGPGGAQSGLQVEYLYGGASYTLLDYLAPVLIAFFAFFFIFLLAAVSFLRERTSGTLERLMATPLRRGELVLGYLLGFSVFALLQGAIVIGFTLAVLKVQYRGNLATIFIVEAAVVIVAVALGLFVSAFARNELQAVQFIPVVILPQAFLSGLLVPVEQLPDVLRPISVILPLTYAAEALRAVMVKGFPLGDPLVLRDLGVLVLFGALTLAGAVASIRREIA